MPKSPKDNEHISIRLLVLEASASGRFGIACVFVIAVLVVIGWLYGR